MGLLTDFFERPGVGVQETELSDPSKLPRFQNRSGDNTYAKFASNNWHNADSTSYWNMLAHVADVVSISQDNVFETVTDYTGSGYFFALVTPSSNIAGAEVHTKITIDGTAYTIPMQLLSEGTAKADIDTAPAASATNKRGHIGYFPFIGSTGGNADDGNGPQSYYDRGFANYTGSIIGIGPDKYGVYGQAGHVGTITPYDYYRFNLHRVRFENSLTVEVKLINGYYTDPYNKTASFWIKDSQTIQ